MKWIWVLEWPNSRMAWFMWGERFSIFSDTRFWRIGPLTLHVTDR